jgi:hypothetical protein
VLSLSVDIDEAALRYCGAEAEAAGAGNLWASCLVGLTKSSAAESKMLACASGMPATVSTLPD